MKVGIEQIGNKVVKCKESCVGIVNDPKNGVLPRCIYFEDSSEIEANTVGCIIIGLNPGKSSKDEKKYFKKNNSYDDVLKYWEEHTGEVKYDEKLREFISTKLDIKGPIYWTEIVKCESGYDENDKKIELNMNTIRKCVNKYLVNELKNIPIEWPIFAVGKQAYQFLPILFPDRKVIGIPHPTGSYGQFAWLINDKDNINELKEIIESEENNAIWIKANKPDTP